MIHTVGPRWQGGAAGEEEVLRRCYRSAIAIARERELRALAFPSISTGAFGYPLELAAPVALEEIGRCLASAPELAITVVCFDAATHWRYSSLAT